MSAGNEVDANVLSWVKSEIDETLGQARSALEVYVENEDDESQLRFCLNYLHQVHGTLQMVELYGASLAAEEMEKLTEALLEGKVSNRNDAYEVLIKGILQLPDYLEQLLAGQQDMPMVLLPLLNDLRAARGEALLSENAMFAPDLSVDAPINEAPSTEDISTLAKKLRHQYHLGLLGWFKDKESDVSLKRISDVISKLRESAGDQEINRLLWIASSLIESLRAGGLDSSVSVKLLLGQLDRQIKKVIDNGITALSQEPPEELLKNLLYYVATSRSEGDITKQVKEAFSLDKMLPDTEKVEQARADLQSPNAALMGTVSSVLLEDLTRVKDILDVFVRSENPDRNQLETLCTTLNQMSDTLGMLGLGLQRRTIQEQLEILNGILSGEREANDDDLMSVAGAMLTIENSLKEMKSARAANEAAIDESDQSATQQLQTAEQHQLLQTVIEEVKIDLNRIKEAVSDFSRNLMNTDIMAPVPDILRQIKGSLAILSLDKASELVGKSGDYIERQIVVTKITPSNADLENLADAISSIEYYLESLSGKWGQPETILAVAEESISRLNIPDAPVAEEQQIESSSVESDDLEFAQSDDTAIDINIADFSADSDTLTDLSMLDLDEPSMEVSTDTLQSEEDTLTDLSVADINQQDMSFELYDKPVESSDDIELVGDLTFEGFDDEAAAEISASDLSIDFPSTDEDEVSLELDMGDSDELSASEVNEINLEESTAELQIDVSEPVAPETPPVDVAASQPSAPVVAETHEVSDDIDDEIIDIFLEEAEEVFADIKRLLPEWQQDEGNSSALQDLRRAFHTLKGSGRLVGASDVGEFAWAYENMLNRVIDNTIQTSPVMFQILNSGCETLPVLFENFRKHEKPEQNVFTLMSHADALSKGENVVLQEVANDSVVIEPEEPHHGEEQAEAEIEVAETQQAPGPLDIDPVLLDIYRKEAAVHIATLRKYTEDWHSGKEQNANYALLRAMHTINGSSRTAGVKSLAELCNAFEKHIQSRQDKLFSKQAVEVLEYVTDFIEQTISLVDQPGAELPDNGALTLAVIDLDTVHEEIPDEAAADETQVVDLVPNIEPAASNVVDLPSAKITEPEPVATANIPSPPAGENEDLGPDFDEELLDIFIEEGEEILDESDHTLNQWVTNNDDPALVEALQRQLHTLKGGARMAGIAEIGDLGHNIESMLTAVVDGHLGVSNEMLKLLQRSQDRLVQMLDVVKQHKRPHPATDLLYELETILRGPKADETDTEESPSPAVSPVTKIQAEEEKPEPESIQVEEPQTVIDVEEPTLQETSETVIDIIEPEIEISIEETPDTTDNVIKVEETPTEDKTIVAVEPQPVVPSAGDTETALAEEAEKTQDRRQSSRIQHEQIRVRSDLLDNLVNFAGEVSIYRSRMEQQSNTFHYNLQELDDTINRFREQLRQFEIETETQIQFRKEESLAQGYEDFDPLEFDRFTQMQHLSRGMMESLGDLDSLRSILSNINRESETLLIQQSRVTSELQEGLMRTRMVQVSGQAPRLRRIVRQTSDELAKPVNFQMHGMDQEIDRTILDRVVPPIEHILRNAIAHGLEKSEQRQKAGKPLMGNINMTFAREGGEIVISISDDGAGINLDAIRKKAIERGLIQKNTLVNKGMLLDMIMQSGFSTAEQVTQIAGRGVGMDVVNTEIKQLGGRLDISTEEGKGSVFTISLPLTLSVSRALLVSIGDETYAIPLLSVEGVERVTQEELMEMAQSDDPVYHWVGNDYRYMHLSSAMGMQQPIIYEEKSVPILLVRSGEYRAAIQVDRLIGSREIVVKPVGPQLSTMRGIAGATIMGDGGVVLILDLGVLIRLAASEEFQPVTEITPEEIAEAHSKVTTVMVVDDSITVRKVTTRFLQRNEMEVITAKDGVDALGQLQLDENIPDVMLLDVEMPRMDGFELATNIRNDERLKHIPIIMITSRTGEKHRERAMDIGVNVYMGKPYNESDLLDNIQNLANT